MKYTYKTYRCELLTPMMMSGASQQVAELRAASIKGMLRWWWRATRGEDDIASMRKDEYELFGGILGDQQRKSQVKLWVRWLDEPTVRPIKDYATLSTDVVKYLAYGSGIGDDNPVRPCFTPGQVFEINLKYPAAFRESVESAVSAMLTYGGFGLKAKNGFGQVYCSDCPTYPLAPVTGSSRYASFKHWDLIILGAYDNADRAHREVAHAYYVSKNPRKTGRGSVSSETLSSSGEKNLFAAHSPHQFQLSSTGQDLERKAKPVQLYVRRTPEGEFEGGIVAFPYELSVRASSNVRPPNAKRGVLSLPSKNHPDVVRQFVDNVRKNRGV